MNKMLWCLVGLMLGGVAVGTRAAEAKFKLEKGYTMLLDVKDLKGWGYQDGSSGKVIDLGKVKQSADARYTAENEEIIVHPWDQAKGQHFRTLWTTREFPKNFHLIFEFRSGTNADSGIFLRKPQLQVRDYFVAGPYRELKKYQPQDWNFVEVTVSNNVAHCTCNGEVLEDALTLPATGPIGLEADRGTMEYRRIRIKELP